VRSGALSPRELVQAAIARIERLNPVLNAVVASDFARALERAAGPLPQGPFTGVPWLVKDLDEYQGVPWRAGSQLFADRVGRHNSEYVTRALASGLVVLGKTSTSELGLLPGSEARVYGAARNPWSPEYSPGGSSGGAAAAVASGMVPLAHATDGGGSIRIPASNCALFGMKPSRGRQPEPGPRLPGDLAVTHAVTRSVRDSQRLLVATALGAADGSALPPPVAPPGEPVRRLRIAFYATGYHGERVHPECRAAVDSAARLCELLGHEVAEGRPALDGESFVENFLVLWASIPHAIVAQIELATGGPPPRGALEPWTWGLVDHFRAQPEGALERAVAYMRQVSEQMRVFHERWDVLLTPTLASPPLRTHELAPDLPFELLRERTITYVSFTPLANATGSPSMSVPLHWTRDGLPVGCLFTAPRGDEATLFGLARQLEEARPWQGRRPSVVA
jgi:amidase